METSALRTINITSPLYLRPTYRFPTFPLSAIFNKKPYKIPLFSYRHLTIQCSSERSSVNSESHGFGGAVSEVSLDRLLQVVLVSPQIPGNTGCIARTCAASSVGLHLVEPLGFQVDDAKLKRAGLDYWPYVVVKIHGSWAEFRDYFRQQVGEKRLLALTKRGATIHSFQVTVLISLTPMKSKRQFTTVTTLKTY
eukprot:TRINITY_DN9865_c0_g1_i3.p1 TRINITY_DN9865_c0_g1~~TRINITY_DN9865_c0_g1_i3.p1  ORF type:complete len:195 (-),score=19.97 TRINITY_DN9865_c0_g1_i3:38-622(-)